MHATKPMQPIATAPAHAARAQARGTAAAIKGVLSSDAQGAHGEAREAPVSEAYAKCSHA